MTSNTTIIKNTLFLYGRMLLILFVTLYTSRILLKTLGIEDFGIYNVVAGFVSMFSFLSAALTNSVQRYLNFELGKKQERHLDDVIQSSFTIQVALILLIILCAETVGLWFVRTQMKFPPDREMQAFITYQLSMATFCVHLFQTPYSAMIIAKEKMGFFALIGVFDATLKLLIAFAIALSSNENRLWIYALLLLIGQVLVLVVEAVYVKILHKHFRISVSRKAKQLKPMLSFSGWNLFGSFSGVVEGQGINVLLNLFFGVTVNAARGIAYQVQAGILNLSRNIITATQPQVIQSYSEGNFVRYEKLTHFASKISFFLVWMATLPVLFTIDSVLRIWLGENIPENTALFTVLVLIIGQISTLSSPIANAIYAVGKMKSYQIFVSIITLMVLPISYVLLKMGLPPQTTMYVSIIVSVFAQMERIRQWKKVYDADVRAYVKSIVAPCVSVVVVTFLLTILLKHYVIITHSDILFVFLFVILTLPVNIFAIYFIGLKRSERELINNKLKKLISKS